MDIFTPIQLLADIVTYQWLGLLKKSYLGDAVNFFIYDTIKIFLLLLVINYVMAMIRYYLPVEKIRDFLTERKWYGLDYFLASLFGVITPFCSCSSIPLFVGFLSAGVPLGVTLAFLITSPLVNEASIAIFIGIFGLKITLLYIVAGVVIGVLGGTILGRMKLEDSIDDSLKNIIARKHVAETKVHSKVPLLILLARFWHEGWELTRSIFLYVVVGAVRDFYGAMADKGANAKGFFITTNVFTLEAEKFAEGKPLELIDGARLIKYIEMAKTGYVPVESKKFCPLCKSEMVKRKGKFGEFYGCSRYPECKGTQKI
jgi:hypothetical protein